MITNINKDRDLALYYNMNPDLDPYPVHTDKIDPDSDLVSNYERDLFWFWICNTSIRSFHDDNYCFFVCILYVQEVLTHFFSMLLNKMSQDFLDIKH